MSDEGQYFCKPLAARSITNSNEGGGPGWTRLLRARLDRGDQPNRKSIIDWKKPPEFWELLLSLLGLALRSRFVLSPEPVAAAAAAEAFLPAAAAAEAAAPVLPEAAAAAAAEAFLEAAAAAEAAAELPDALAAEAAAAAALLAADALSAASPTSPSGNALA